jgi:pantoate--beta-alanine ligase
VRVIERMVRDFHLGIVIIGAETVRRGSNSVAMSSRNCYMDPTVHTHPAILYEALCAARDTLLKNENKSVSLASIEAAACAYINESGSGFVADYVAVRDSATLQPLDEARVVAGGCAGQRVAILGAAVSDKGAHHVRLIDNIEFTL